MKQLVYEGVPYYRYRVRYVTTAGKRRTKVLYAPGRPWIGETVNRWISGAEIPIKRGSNVVISRFPHACEVH